MALASLLLWVRRRVALVAVEGGSMSPTLLPGDWLAVESLTYAWRPPRAGELVLAVDPRDAGRELIKRAYPDASGRFVHLLGDADGRTSDSRRFGPLPRAAIRWRVVARYWPPARARLLRADHAGASPRDDIPRTIPSMEERG